MNPVDEAILSRRAVRAFLPTPVPIETVRHLLAVASRAPSSSNTQPWNVYALTGAPKEKLSAAILKARREEPPEAHKPEYQSYMKEWREPYISRRRATGWGLYNLVGVTKGDREGARRQMERNFVFFDAPVGLIITLDRDLELGSWVDLGTFLQNIMVAARGHGLHTCPQAAFMDYHKIIRAELGVSEREIVICGMAIGHEDTSKPENDLRLERAPVDEFVRFFGF
ncbi:MAG: nitroreductase [Alphaproteobacteria bacterium]|nr:nitroreductase [Alphaproteobacteria bacterium]